MKTLRIALAALSFAVAPAMAQTHVLIVSGLGGEARFSERFRTMGSDLSSSLHTRFFIPDANIAWLGEDSTSRDPRYKGRSTREAVEREAKAIQARVKPGEQVVFVLIGHGSGGEAESRISLPGNDLTVTDFQRIIGGFADQRIAFVNLTSGSGDFLPILATKGRVVITATKTAFERNESRFGENFVAALAKDVADVDKDGRVSLLEAFNYAARETKRIYDDATKLQSEHAQLDDNGTKQNTAEPNGRDGQGLLARRFFLDARGTAAAHAGDAVIAALYAERFALENTVDSLRVAKKTADVEAYEAELERVMIALARKSRDIRKAEGRP